MSAAVLSKWVILRPSPKITNAGHIVATFCLYAGLCLCLAAITGPFFKSTMLECICEEKTAQDIILTGKDRSNICNMH